MARSFFSIALSVFGVILLITALICRISIESAYLFLQEDGIDPLPTFGMMMIVASSVGCLAILTYDFGSRAFKVATWSIWFILLCLGLALFVGLGNIRANIGLDWLMAMTVLCFGINGGWLAWRGHRVPGFNGLATA